MEVGFIKVDSSEQSENDSIINPYDYEGQSVLIESEGKGITSSEIRNRIDERMQKSHRVAVPTWYKPTNTSVKFFLNQGWTVIDGPHEKYKKMQDFVVSHETPDYAPTTVRFDHHGLYPNVVYEVQVRTCTDIWWRDTTGNKNVDAVARINKANISNSINRLLNIDSVVDTEIVTVDFGGPELMKAVINYNGPQLEQLLAEYRKRWIETNLREQAQSYETDDGTRGVDFGTVTEQIQLEELKARLEAYIAADDSADTVVR